MVRKYTNTLPFYPVSLRQTPKGPPALLFFHLQQDPQVSVNINFLVSNTTNPLLKHNRISYCFHAQARLNTLTVEHHESRCPANPASTHLFKALTPHHSNLPIASRRTRTICNSPSSNTIATTRFNQATMATDTGLHIHHHYSQFKLNSPCNRSTTNRCLKLYSSGPNLHHGLQFMVPKLMFTPRLAQGPSLRTAPTQIKWVRNWTNLAS